MLYQAGASARGLTFAGTHAECVFISAPTQPVLARAVDGIRRAVAQAGRDPDAVFIYAQALIVTDRTEALARAKFDDYRSHIDIEAALTLLSGWTGIDFSGYAPDAKIEYLENDAGRTALASFSKADPNRSWTVGEAAQFVGLGGRGPVLVGDPDQVADALESWVDRTGVDGFNLTYAIQPDTFVDVVDLVVPRLQARGRYRATYTDGTLRAKLFGRGDRLSQAHVARRTGIRSATPLAA